MGVSNRPSDFSDDRPQPLDNTKSERKRILSMSLDDVQRSFLSPPAEPNAYLDMYGVPCAWAECFERVSAGHLSVHLFCLASGDDKQDTLYRLREEAKLASKGTMRGLAWLRRRPRFYLNGLDMENTRTKVFCWSWEWKKSIGGFAKERGFTQRSIVLAYGAKSLLTSSVDFDGWDNYLREIVRQWDEYLDREIKEIRQEFSLD